VKRERASAGSAWKIAGETERNLRKDLLLSVAMLRFVF